MRMVFLSTVSTSVIVMFPPESGVLPGEVPKEETVIECTYGPDLNGGRALLGHGANGARRRRR